MPIIHRVLLVVSCFPLAASSMEPARAGELLELEEIEGYPTTAWAINAHGRVVGSGHLPGQAYQHALLWDIDTTKTDLGTLGGHTSIAMAVNSSLQIAGKSQISGDAETHAFLWEAGVMTDLGTLGGKESYPWAINGAGQIVGDSLIPGNVVYHSFLWDGASMIDIGLVYAPDINESGQIVGQTPDGRGAIWENGVVTDLGTLGGTTVAPYAINDAGQVVGLSTLTGDAVFHAFLWDDGGMIDLGTLGGTTSVAMALNENRQVVGYSDLPGDAAYHAFVWADGVMTDLGVIDTGTSIARSINDAGQIVGCSGCSGGFPYHPFLWESGVMKDLGTMGGPFGEAIAINAGGWITGDASPENSRNLHAFLYRPGYCDFRAGNVDTGDGSPPVNVLSVDGQVGDACRCLVVDSNHDARVTIESAPSLGSGHGHYALWVYDGWPPFGGADLHLLTRSGVLYDLGRGARALPINNTEVPGSVPCPVSFPSGFTSKPLGNARAETLCLNKKPGYPKAPRDFFLRLDGNFTVGALVQDLNSPNSPQKNISIANWILVSDF